MQIYSAATGRFQTLATGAAATTSSVITAATVDIISGKVGHYVAVGSSPTATTSSFFVPADHVITMTLTDSTSTKVSVLAENSTGVVTLAY